MTFVLLVLVLIMSSGLKKKCVYITRTYFDCSDKISCVNESLAVMRTLPIGRFSEAGLHE